MRLFSTLILLLLFLQIHAQTDCVNISIETLNVSCQGANDGIIDLTVSEGTPPYTFLWSNGDTTEDLSGLSIGSYSVIVTDSVGCVSYFPEVSSEDFPLEITDGIGVALDIPLEVTQFSTTDTLASVEAFEIHTIIEHTWLRDLEITIQCPDGKSAILHDHPGNLGGEKFLGSPIDGDNPPTPGIGWDYWWTNNSTNGTWLSFCNTSGSPHTLPSQDYKSYDDLENLIGCPLNGEWQMSYTDNWGGDNGFVFDWYLTLNGENIGKNENLSIQGSTINCIDCSEEYHCMQWLRDTISHNSYSIQMGTWNERTVFFTVNYSAIDDNFIYIFDCEGNLIQSFTGKALIPNPSPALLTHNDIIDTQTIWSQDVSLADCDDALSASNITILDVSCFGASDGDVCTEATGGLPPYSFLWEDENGSTFEGECISNLPAGTYNVIITDHNNTTTAPTFVEIATPDEIIIDIELSTDTTNTSCIATINVTGGTLPYSITSTPEIIIDEVMVTVTDVNGCTAQNDATCIIDGVNEIETTPIFIHPNPTSSHFYISTTNNEAIDNILIYNSLGQLILQTKERKVDISAFITGIYIVQVEVAKKVGMGKLVVKR